MTFPLENIILKMVTGEKRPAQSYDKETKKWIPTGGEEIYYEYFFVTDDEFKEKIVLNSKKDFSKFEGKKVIAVCEIKYDSFGKKMRAASLVEVLAAGK